MPEFVGAKRQLSGASVVKPGRERRDYGPQCEAVAPCGVAPDHGVGNVLEDLDLEDDYRSGRDSLLEDFYIPCLQEAIAYDRAVGYFSSSLLHMVAIAFSEFVRRGGHMRLICSPALRPDDFDAMKQAVPTSEQAQVLVREELDELLTRPESVAPTRLLGSLVKASVVEVQLAFLDDTSGIFHDKLGVFQDENGGRVSFVGSANETWAAWGLNHESFEVFGSWRGEADLLRTRRHARDFDRLWKREDDSVRVEPLDRVTRDRLIDIADDDLDRAMAAVRSRPASTAPARRALMEHQLAVLENWRTNGQRGIVAFATGAGKTLTALEAVREWTQPGRPALILVPSRELHRQWREELALEIPEATPLLCGAGHGRDSWGALLGSYTAPSAETQGPRVTLVTNATFSSPDFRSRLRAGDHLLVVGDEMHRLGSRQSLAALLETSAGATLGLSATYRRKFDELGTEALVEWFGPVLEPVIGLAEAIMIGRLVPYDYRLHTLRLEEDELEQYAVLTQKIGKASASSSGDPSDYMLMLLIQRARLLKQARGKVNEATAILLREFHPGERWLVYCDDTNQLSAIVEQALAHRLPVMEFHSAMVGDRDAVLNSLAAHGGIVVAIRCLDEGVDLPACDRALIVASSTVDREYIQRRGRVLRTANHKVSAVVHDLLLTDDHGGVLTRSEALRALEFARLARNPAARARLQSLLALSPDLENLPGVELLDDADDEERDS